MGAFCVQVREIHPGDPYAVIEGAFGEFCGADIDCGNFTRETKRSPPLARVSPATAGQR